MIVSSQERWDQFVRSSPKNIRVEGTPDSFPCFARNIGHLIDTPNGPYEDHYVFFYPEDARELREVEKSQVRPPFAGLEDGRIPAGMPCPFFHICELKNSNCPHESLSNLRPVPFSCAAARGFAMLIRS